MDALDQEIDKWYEKVKNEINFDNRVCYFLSLVEDLKCFGLQKEDLSFVGPKICDILKKEYNNEMIAMSSEAIIGYEIREVFDISFFEMEEIKEDYEDIDVDEYGVSNIKHNDVVPNNPDVEEIDLRGIDTELYLDIEYLNKLKA